jgi:hypothetical protein
MLAGILPASARQGESAGCGTDAAACSIADGSQNSQSSRHRSVALGQLLEPGHIFRLSPEFCGNNRSDFFSQCRG